MSAWTQFSIMMNIGIDLFIEATADATVRTAIFLVAGVAFSGWIGYHQWRFSREEE